MLRSTERLRHRHRPVGPRRPPPGPGSESPVPLVLAMPNLTDILLPAEQTEGTTNVVGKWFKRVGDAVALNEPLLEITTDKVTVEIPAPADGVLVEILKQEGAEVEPGSVLGRIGPPGTAMTAAALPGAAARTAKF